MMHDDLKRFDRGSGGDAQAGPHWVGRHYEAVYVLLVSRLPEHYAADLTQETFEAMGTRAEGLRIHSSVVSSRLGIARRTLVQFLSGRPRRTLDPVADSCASLEASPSITAMLGDQHCSSTTLSAYIKSPPEEFLRPVRAREPHGHVTP